MLKRKLPLWLALVLLSTIVKGAQAQETLPELIRRVKPAVVAVITYDAKNEVQMTGSGFFIRPGQVLTNLHVIDEAHHVEIRTLDGKGKTYAADGIVSLDEEGDLAVLGINIPVDRARSLELASALPEEGEEVFVIGNPLRLEGSVSNGIVSAVREVPSLGEIIQITAPISHGNSGSPLFNMKGQIIGVITMKVTNGQNINLALGASRLRQLRPGKLLTFAEKQGGSAIRDAGRMVVSQRIEFALAGKLRQRPGLLRERRQQESQPRRGVDSGRLLQGQAR
jgi:S1-C subfamily serine protease